MTKLLSGRILPGDRLTLPDTAILGQNITRAEDGFSYSIVSGVLERYGDHFAVLPQRQHYYRPQQCDLVVGRVTALKVGSWYLEINALHSATLSIDSINLPGLLRVRDSADEAFQRSWLTEGEVVAAEIKRVSPISLNARSTVMGKLSHGILIQGAPYHVTALKSYYNQQGVRLVVGRNGWIWLSAQVKESVADVNSCIDRREQKYSEEELSTVGMMWRKIYAAIRLFGPISEEDLFE